MTAHTLQIGIFQASFRILCSIGSESLDADWHWYRLEYQARGSTHAHGCDKLKNDSCICSLMQKAAFAWSIKQKLNSRGEEQTEHQEQVIQEGEESKAAVCLYSDWLVTTCNESIPDDQWIIPDLHPCSLQFEHINDMNQDYHNLVNVVERLFYDKKSVGSITTLN